MALVNQKSAVRQGNPNATLYGLASKQQTGGAVVFHDVTTGTNTVPGLTGFHAGPGYDQASGLGSVDASVMVNHWTDATSAPTPGLQVGLSASAISVAPGASASINVTVGVAGGFNSSVQLLAVGLPSGVTAAFTPAALSAPGSGSSTLTISTDPLHATVGSYPIQVTVKRRRGHPGGLADPDDCTAVGLHRWPRSLVGQHHPSTHRIIGCDGRRNGPRLGQFLGPGSAVGRRPAQRNHRPSDASKICRSRLGL